MRITRESFRVPVLGYGWVRLLPAGGAVGYIALLHLPAVEPSGWDWLLALTSAGLVLAAGPRPLIVTLTQCVLLVAATAVAPTGAGVVQVLTCVGLGELALRRPGRPMWSGALAVAAASGWNVYPAYSVAAKLLIVLLDVGLPLLLGSFLRSVRELARHAEGRAAEAERRRAWEVKAARAAERSAIARELHDVVAHHVSSIVLRVGVVRHVVDSGEHRLVEALDDVHTIGAQALADLRRLVAVLRDPDTVEDPGLLGATDLSAALVAVMDRTRQAGVAVDAVVDPAVVDGLDTVHRYAVLRVVQEGLTNVLKHAGPGASTQVIIHTGPDGRVLIEVCDDGGCAPARRGGTHPGHGLIVMRERVELLEGSFEAGPIGAGWTLRAALPQTSLVEVAS